MPNKFTTEDKDILDHLDGKDVMGTSLPFVRVTKNQAVYFAPSSDWKWGDDEGNRPIEEAKLIIDKKYRDVLGADEEIIILIMSRKTHEDYVSSKVAKEVIEDNA